MRMLVRCFGYAGGFIAIVVLYVFALAGLGFVVNAMVESAGWDPGTFPMIFAPLCVAFTIVFLGAATSLGAIGREKSFVRYTLAHSAEIVLAIVAIGVVGTFFLGGFFLLSKLMFEEIANFFGLVPNGLAWVFLVYLIPGAICLAAGEKVLERIYDPVFGPLDRWKNKRPPGR